MNELEKYIWEIHNEIDEILYSMKSGKIWGVETTLMEKLSKELSDEIDKEIMKSILDHFKK